VRRIIWTGTSPATQSTILSFSGEARELGDYAFNARQIYSDGSIADWSGFPDADEPAASVHVANSLGSDRGGTSTLGVVAVILAGAALLVSIGGTALRRRPLA
jgi:hypothetical protein